MEGQGGGVAQGVADPKKDYFIKYIFAQHPKTGTDVMIF
jgi:hypothetical protein